MTESIEQIKAQVQNMILEHGFAVQYVGGEQPYGYTIGRTMRNRPELLISGLPVGITHECLSSAVALDDVEPFKASSPRHGIFEGYQTFPITIDPWRAEMHTAIATFGRLTALQLLWPDDAGAFPGDPDFAHDVSIQRVFA